MHSALPPLYGLAWNAITERLLDGRVSKLHGLDAEDKAALLFLQIYKRAFSRLARALTALTLPFYSVGPARARDFAADGCRSFEDLWNRHEELKPKLSRANKIGLLHREDIQRLIPRIEMDALRDALGKAVQTVDPTFEFEILGSYRRGVPFSSDIDLAVRHQSFIGSEGQEALGKSLLGSIIEQLEVEKLVRKEHELARGVKKFAVRSRSSFAESVTVSLLTQARAGSDSSPGLLALPTDRCPPRTFRLLPLHAARIQRRFASHEASTLHGQAEGILSQ